jgi:hypothetical protein
MSMSLLQKWNLPMMLTHLAAMALFIAASQIIPSAASSDLLLIIAVTLLIQSA